MLCIIGSNRGRINNEKYDRSNPELLPSSEMYFRPWLEIQIFFSPTNEPGCGRKLIPRIAEDTEPVQCPRVGKESRRAMARSTTSPMM